MKQIDFKAALLIVLSRIEIKKPFKDANGVVQTFNRCNSQNLF